MDFLKAILIAILLLCVRTAFCQEIDSIKVIFSDAGNGGERYRVFYKGEKKIDVKSTKRGHGFYSFKIKNDEVLQENNYLPIQVNRKKRFGFCFKESLMDFEYESDMKYLVIGRDYILKNRYAFNYMWTNSIRWEYQ